MRDVHQDVDALHTEDPDGEDPAVDADAPVIDAITGAEPRSSDVEGAAQREPAGFLSTRLLRELIAADARCEGVGTERAARAAALLAAVLSGLELAGGAIVLPAGEGGRDEGLCLAAQGIADHARELLEARVPLETLGASLAQRAMVERRGFLLDRSTRDPLMPALREGNAEIESAVVVPLLDQEVAAGAIVLAARAGRLSAPLVRSLAVAFRLLGLLLAPARGRPAAAPRGDDPGQAATDRERDLFEMEELGARLAEAREAAASMEERATSAEAALRAEAESARARIAELEARFASEAPGAARLRELEGICAIQAATIEDREQRIAALEGEVVLLAEREPYHREGNGTTTWGDAEEGGDRLEAEAESVELPDNGGDVQLGDIAEAAAASLGQGADDGAGDAGESEQVDLADAAEGALDAALDAANAIEDETLEIEDRGDVHDVAEEHPLPAYGVLHVDSSPEAAEAVRAAAEGAGAPYASADGPAPRASATIAVVNLLDGALAERLAADSDVWSASRWILYGTDPENGSGFDLGSSALLGRPIDPHRCVEQIQRRVGRKLGGIVLVSAQLRELAALRNRLHEIDAAGSVACDTRQALDLLEIVRCPDAIVIDLALPQGQGLALAAQLRRQSETSSLPLLLLLPEEPDPARLRGEAERAQLLEPFVAEDVRRLVRAALAGGH